jgi:hypothetical protein
MRPMPNLHGKSEEVAELRELLGGVAQMLEALTAENPPLASRFLARAQRLQWRL